jgi:hypothetical protein
MKKLLLAFALIGFIATTSFATSTELKANAEVEFCDDKGCDKKSCDHKKGTAKKECTKGDKKACCKTAKAGDKKACCSKDKGAGKSCHGKADAKTSGTKPVKEEKKETK